MSVKYNEVLLIVNYQAKFFNFASILCTHKSTKKKSKSSLAKLNPKVQ